MPISPKLSRQLDAALGTEAAEELVNWIHDMDAQRRETRDTVRADIAELRQETQAGLARSDEKLAELRQDMLAGFARSDAKLQELRQEMQADFATLRQDMLAGFARVETQFATVRGEMAGLESRFERRFADLIKWSFVFWVGAVGAVALLAGALG